MPDPQLQRRMPDYDDILKALQALRDGDFAVRMPVECGGSAGEIARVFNEIVETSAAVTAEVARVREQVGIEGRHGERMRLPAAPGPWTSCVEAINSLIEELVRPVTVPPTGVAQIERRQFNQTLREKARRLSVQMKEVEARNRDVEAARAMLELKVEQLASISRYKSEFLANMSHELRTPLNSLLILAQLLAENARGNLSPTQVEYAQTICVSGNELLVLINDILDLAKVESGTVALNLTDDNLEELHDYVERSFRPVANAKGLAFRIAMATDLPETIRTDPLRLRQILQNLLSNAFKFTDSGAVTLDVYLAHDGWNAGNKSLDDAEAVVAFAVIDTGPGIPTSKQAVIFEPFQQLDGASSRRFGGTGLGLSISCELTRLLGGALVVKSSPGEGSTFTLFQPAVVHAPGGEARSAPVAESRKLPQSRGPGAGQPSPSALIPAGDTAYHPDDRARILPGDRVALIVADDPEFAQSLLEQARALGFKALVVVNVHTALAFANEYMPTLVTIAIRRPKMDGWALLDLLKQDPDTRPIPVNLIAYSETEQDYSCKCRLSLVSAANEEQALQGALHRLSRFLGLEPKTMLIAAGSKAWRQELVAAMAEEGLHVTSAATGVQALKIMRSGKIDCTMIGHSLADMEPADLVREMIQVAPVGQDSLVIRSAPGLPGGIGTESADGRAFAEILLLKRVNSFEAVLGEIERCLQQVTKEQLPRGRRPDARILQAAPELTGRRALIVDDEIRNTFALTSVLEQQGMQVASAESGLNAVAMLRKDPNFAIILMDLMMPEQDGYQTIRAIRAMNQFKNIPIIGITAQAMKGDREKCIEAGASDYIAKPVKVDQLVSVIRMWLGEPGK